MNNDPNDKSHPNYPFNKLPPGARLDHETMTAEQLQALAPVLVPKWESDYESFLHELKAKATKAAADDEALRQVLCELKGFEAQLASWNERLGALSTDRLEDLQRQFSRTADDIAAALNSPLPEQDDDPGEPWEK